MKAILRIAAAASGVVLLLGVAPPVLSQFDAFHVRRVEVRGTRYLAPDEALRASTITQADNVFDDFATWRAALEEHPLIERARIERVLPGTIRIVITEAEPIALVGGAGPRSRMRAVTADGELLPVDPTAIDLDLPVVAAPVPTDARVWNPETLRALRVLDAIRTAEPVLFGWISDAEPARDAVRFRLRSPAGAVALLPDEPDAQQSRILRLALAHLSARGSLDRVLRLDARFRGQIVVAFTPKDAT